MKKLLIVALVALLCSDAVLQARAIRGSNRTGRRGIIDPVYSKRRTNRRAIVEPIFYGNNAVEEVAIVEPIFDEEAIIDPVYDNSNAVEEVGIVEPIFDETDTTERAGIVEPIFKGGLFNW